jgi:TRAP-type C4-dicarboxylate transport system permease small subunit
MTNKKVGDNMSQISKMALSIEVIINRISRILNIIGVTFLVAMMLLTVTDVFLRYIFNQPILGSVEITEYFMAVVGFSGLAWCAANIEHARVDLLVTRFSRRAQAIFDSISYFLCLTVAPLVAWQGFASSNYAREIGKYSFLLEIPAYPFYMVLGVGFAALSLTIMVLLVKSIAEAIRG